MNSETLDTVISLSEKRTELLKEYKESLKYESCTHHVECDKQYPHKFFLTDTATQQLLVYDTTVQIRKWLTRRNIPADKVFGYEAIKEKSPYNPPETDYENNHFSKRIHR